MDPPAGREALEGGREGVGALALAEEERPAQGEQHVSRAVPEDLRDEVGSRGAGRGVVEADIGHPGAVAHVGDECDDGDAAVGEAPHGGRHGRVVRCLEHDAVADAPTTTESVEHLDGGVDVGVLAQVEASPHRSRAQRRQLVLEGGPDCRAEARRGLDHDVEQEGPGRQAQLGLLAVEVEHGLLDGADRPRAGPRATVEHPVDRRLRQAGLLGDVAHAVRVGSVGAHAPERNPGMPVLRSF